MTVAVRLDARATKSKALYAEPALGAALLPISEAGSRLPTAELAFRIIAAFRAHPHINNVLTHISRAKWADVERAIEAILDSATTSDGLSPLARNIVDLMCAERGVTGRILKPYFHSTLHRVLEPMRAERLIRHIQALHLELEWQAGQPAPAPSEPSKEAGHD